MRALKWGAGAESTGGHDCTKDPGARTPCLEMGNWSPKLQWLVAVKRALKMGAGRCKATRWRHNGQVTALCVLRITLYSNFGLCELGPLSDHQNIEIFQSVWKILRSSQNYREYSNECENKLAFPNYLCVVAKYSFDV
jgi:hypothetical protein